MMSVSASEARVLTERIRENINDYARLMVEAWRNKIWLPLGYTSYGAWLRSELGLSRSRGYQILNVGIVEEHIRDRVPLPPDTTISDLNTRAILNYGLDDFIHRLTLEAGDDVLLNEQLLHRHLFEIGVVAVDAPPPAPVFDYEDRVEDRVEDPVSADDEALIVLDVFLRTAGTIPPASDAATDPELFAQNVDRLKETHARLVALIGEYENVGVML